jgi:hypothetical protein
VSPPTTYTTDPRDAEQLVAALRARRPGYVPEGAALDAGAGAALARVAAGQIQAILRRLDQAPAKGRLAFLDTLGVSPVPAQEARAVVVFSMSDGAPDAHVPAGTQIAAAAGNTQVVFQTEQDAGVSSAKLAGVFSDWPGRDQYIDHTADLAAGRTIFPFRSADLKNTPRAIYLAHETMLALSGKTRLEVAFDLTTPGSAPLGLAWQYWDGTVWRDFASTATACRGSTGPAPDSTNGLTESGRFVLETDCAQTSPTAVDGITSFWVRAQLTQPLPPDPSRILPEVGAVALRTRIERPLAFTASRPKRRPRLARSILSVRVQDAGGAPLKGVALLGSPELQFDPDFVRSAGNVAATFRGLTTPDSGSRAFFLDSTHAAGQVQAVTVEVGGVSGSFDLTVPDSPSEVQLTFTLTGFRPDKAFADATEVDLTKTSYPFGLQPAPGAAFYLKSEEALTKPGATVQLIIVRTSTPQDQALAGMTGSQLAHHVVWEYWDGRQWAVLFEADDLTGSDSGDLNRTEVLGFTVPDDMEETTVNGEPGHWVRARLVSGGFGLVVTFNSTNPSVDMSFTVPQPPALADLRLGYTWQNGPKPPAHTLTLNDFGFDDRTEQVLWPGTPFAPFRAAADSTPALYLGFTQALPVDNDGIDFAVEEQPGQAQGPGLVWEYWDGFAWTGVDVTDETQALGIPGLVSFVGPDDSRPLARFGTPVHWLRARLKEDGPPGTPAVDGISPNATRVVQRQTVVNEAMGASTGLPDQVFRFRQVPVLAGEFIEVRESVAPRAGIEWRLIARDVSGGDTGLVAALEALLAAEGPQTSVELGGVRLTRDRTKQVTEVWVRWRSMPTLFLSGPNDRVYSVERSRGRLQFGDGHGMVPPVDAAVLARLYQTGGGAAGNVAANTMTQLRGAIGKLEGVTNPRPAGGGTDAETFASLLERGPSVLKTRGRALSPGDYETLARQAAPDLAVAHALPAVGPDGVEIPGWVTLVIIPLGDDPRPSPSFGLRESVRAYIEARAPADVAAGAQLNVTGPVYQPVDVNATLVADDPGRAGDVLIGARETLTRFLHPLLGGPEGRGWPPNRAVYLSDVALALRGVAGLDYVRDLTLSLGGVPQGDSAPITGGRVVAAGVLLFKAVPGQGG